MLTRFDYHCFVQIRIITCLFAVFPLILPDFYSLSTFIHSFPPQSWANTNIDTFSRLKRLISRLQKLLQRAIEVIRNKRF